MVIKPDNSEIGFKIKHLMINNVSGNFNKYDVEVETTGDDFTTASITAKIDVASINTNNEHVMLICVQQIFLKLKNIQISSLNYPG